MDELYLMSTFIHAHGQNKEIVVKKSYVKFYIVGSIWKWNLCIVFDAYVTWTKGK